jgi:proteasome lid subunit RPN8/RPN11
MEDLFEKGRLPDDFVRASIPIARYFEVVGNWSQAARDEQQPLEVRYVAALRLSHLLVSLLPRHPDLARLPRFDERRRSNAALAVELAEKLASEVRLERMAQQLGLKIGPPPPQSSVLASASGAEKGSDRAAAAAVAAAAPSPALVASSDDPGPPPPSLPALPPPPPAVQKPPPVQRVSRIAASLFEMFAKSAALNTARNVETCGMLCGRRVQSGLVITHILVPQQTGTSDYCAATDEEGLLDAQLRLDLICVGWIHTHPQHKCFLSSIDLHTSVSYQALLPDALAVVLAPTDVKLPVGIFRLTQHGLKLVLQCPLRGFHPHDESQGALYGLAKDVAFDASLTPTIVDLRVNNKM